MALAAAGCVAPWGCAPHRSAPIEQPLAFSHATHVTGEELRCKDCHDAETAVRAGFPDIKYCHECHSQPEGDHPDEPKVREYYEAKKQIPWIQVNRNEGHVYFSHRVHVTLAEMECEDCHGDVASLTEPLPRPVPELHSMEACMECHEERGASQECITCHD